MSKRKLRKFFKVWGNDIRSIEVLNDGTRVELLINSHYVLYI